jgi:hypothetical protein
VAAAARECSYASLFPFLPPLFISGYFACLTICLLAQGHSSKSVKGAAERKENKMDETKSVKAKQRHPFEVGTERAMI